jgi:hypothetical protein
MKESAVKKVLSILNDGLKQLPYSMPGTITLNNNSSSIFIKKREYGYYLVEEILADSRSINYYELNEFELQKFLKRLKGYN